MPTCRRPFLLLLWILVPLAPVWAEEPHILPGRVVGAADRLPIPYASVVSNGGHHAVTDENGRFRLRRSPNGNDRLTVRHVAFETVTVETGAGDTAVTIALREKISTGTEVVVEAARRPPAPLSGLSTGNLTLQMRQLEALPRFMGAADPLKLLQLVPGVQTAGEGNAGIFVRGAEPGHNRITLNGAPLFNASHLVGSFSVFNADHIETVTLKKGHVEASSESHLAAVVAAETADTAAARPTVRGSVGLIHAQATFSTPLDNRKRYGLTVSARQTYLGLLVLPLLDKMAGEKPGESKESDYAYEFCDLNLTLTARPTDRDRVVLNGYYGGDRVKAGDSQFVADGTLKWSNGAASLRWNRTISEQTALEQTLYYSRYDNRVTTAQGNLKLRLPSHVQEAGYNGRIDLKLRRIGLSAGMAYVFDELLPQAPRIALANGTIHDAGQQRFRGERYALFADATIPLSARLEIGAGIRGTLYRQIGPYTDVRGGAGGQPADTTRYGAGSSPCLRFDAEPRLSLRWRPDALSTVQASYNRQTQYLNLVSISSLGLPTDFWVLASKGIPPQRAHNISVACFREFPAWGLELSVEGYYKRLEGQVEYKNNLFDFYTQEYRLENSLQYGRGKAYGAELLLKKNGRRWNGWIGYTLGWSLRSFPGIENGRWFSAKHDRRHDLTVAGSYRPTDRWDFSGVFVYATGNACTMPVSVYVVNGNVLREYGPYNGSRMPAYHRLDLSATYWLVNRGARRSGINISVYNCYKRNNPFYVYYRIVENEGAGGGVSIRKKYRKLFDILPSISWIFSF